MSDASLLGALGLLLDRLLAHGDLGHVGLLLWGVSASWTARLLLREAAESRARFDLFVREIEGFNRRFGGPGPAP